LPRPAALIGMRSFLFLLVAVPALAFADTKAGDRAGDFTLKDLDGQATKLSDLKGQIVVLDFWASWCAPCKKELPALDALAAKYPGKFVVVGVNVDKSKDNATKTLRALSIQNVHVLLDPDGSIASQYDLPKMPSSFVIDQKGIVRGVHAGYDDGDEKKVEAELKQLIQ
jgi:peroxiredoxin